jgi:hypothetical protein
MVNTAVISGDQTISTSIDMSKINKSLINESLRLAGVANSFRKNLGKESSFTKKITVKIIPNTFKKRGTISCLIRILEFHIIKNIPLIEIEVILSINGPLIDMNRSISWEYPKCMIYFKEIKEAFRDSSFKGSKQALILELIEKLKKEFGDYIKIKVNYTKVITGSTKPSAKKIKISPEDLSAPPKKISNVDIQGYEKNPEDNSSSAKRKAKNRILLKSTK